MDINNYKDGVYPVTLEGQAFMLSITRDKFNCLKGVAAFKHRDKRPLRGQHKLLTNNVKNWLAKMKVTS